MRLSERCRHITAVFRGEAGRVKVKSMKIYLARHGTTEWNSKRLIQGRTDTALDDAGIEMAKQSGRRLKELNVTFSHVFSSPLKRAYTTALYLTDPDAGQTASSADGDGIITDSRLTELYFGDFEGMNVETMTGDPDCIFRFFKSDPKRYNDEIIRNGLPAEDLASLLERASDFVREVIEPILTSGKSAPTCTHDLESNILISGHGAVNKALLMYFEGKNDLSSFWGNGLQPNCGINKISCTVMTDKRIIYDVQDECLTLYDKNLITAIPKLL